jgi:hypothetical protein
LEQGADPLAADVRGRDVLATLLDTAPDSLLTFLDHFIQKSQASLGADNLEGKWHELDNEAYKLLCFQSCIEAGKGTFWPMSLKGICDQ